MKYKKSLLFGLLLAGISLFTSFDLLVAQTTIKGKVFEAGTADPLTGVNVYISGTTLGASTGLEGEYEFTTNLSGEYELVVSFLGFKTQSKTIKISDESEMTFNFVLRADLMQMDEIQVTADDNDDWERSLRKFKEFFLGHGGYLEGIEILNPEVLDFVEIVEGHVVVNARGPLLVENSMLGYNIELEFDKVYFNPYDNTGYWSVYPRFQEMQSPNRAKMAKWEERREDAYIGSSKHFFISLIYEDLKNDKFYVLPRMNAIEKVEDPELIQKVFPNNWEEIVERYHVYRAADINFGIVHNPELTVRGEPKSTSAYSAFDAQNFAGLVVVDNNGMVFNSEDVIFIGPWAEDRFDKTLPLDYATYVRMN